MNLKDIEALDKEFLLAEDIAPIINADPQTIRSQAQANPRQLGFPVIVTGARVRIPKEGFLYFCRRGYAGTNA